MAKFQIPLADYNRIHQVAHGVLSDIANVERACVFFACFGAMMLSKHYKIPARVVAGAFGLCAADKPDVLFFGKIKDGEIASAADGFHMWIQTKSHIIDFMAPIYQEAFSTVRPDLTIPRRMLQRPIITEAKRAAQLNKTGDFITYPDLQLTDLLVDNFLNHPDGPDLIRVAEEWFGSRKRAQTKSFSMLNDLGEVLRLTLPQTTARTSW